MFGNKPRRITVEMGALYGEKTYPVLEQLDVSLHDGLVTITADAYTAARLAGREIFGAVRETQQALEDKIAGSWYTADCPSMRDPA